MESKEDGSVDHEAEYIEQKGQEDEDEDEDGPPPGWESIPPLPREDPSLSPPPTTPVIHQPRLLKEEEQMQHPQDDDDDDGWLCNLTPPPSPIREEDQREMESMEAQPALEEEYGPPPSPAKEEKEREIEPMEAEEDGPPPGWQSLPPSAVAPTSSMCEPSVDSASALPPSPSEEDEREIKPMEVQPTEAEEEAQADVEEDGPPPGWQSIPPPSASTQTTPPLPSSSTSGPPIEPPFAPSPQPSEMAQMVCGSCRHLLSYPKGSRHVKCACCQTTNIVLEAHELGIVKCGSCTVLLMYPYAASSVRCASCRFVTEIGEHNKRPPWSVQQGYPPPTNPVH